MNETPQAAPQSVPGQSRTWEVACHLSALCLFTPVPFAHLLAPLIVWLMKRSESADVDAQGKEALNWQISFSLYGLGLGVMGFGSFLLTFILGPLSLVLIIAVAVAGSLLAIANVVMIIIAALKASDGVCYRYPMSIRFLR